MAGADMSAFWGETKLMEKTEEYVAAKCAWQAAMQDVMAAKEALMVKRQKETEVYRALIAITQSLSPVEVAGADEQWRKQWQEPT